MSRVLLINPAFEFVPKDLKVYAFPFGLAYIASYLRQLGHTVDVWDIHARRITIHEALRQLPNVLSREIDHVGITGIVNQYLYVKRLAEAIRKHSNAVITVGGPLSTYSHDLILRNSAVDLCVLGPGEFTYADIVAGKPREHIGGLAFRTDGGPVQVTPDARCPRDLDALPRPAYDLFDTEFYLAHTRLMEVVHPWHRGRKVAALVTSRGCPYQCRFCSKSIRQVALHSVDYVIDQVKFMKEQFGVDAVLFEDELLVLSKSRTLEFCEKIRPLGILWNAQGRVNLVDRETLLAMKNSGCICIGFGIESGSQRILDNMKKAIQVDQVREALTICKEIGLLVKIQLIFGYPGEDDTSLQETINLFKELRYPGCRMNIITPLPGSALYDQAKADGFIGDGEHDTISEEAFLEYLSLNAGMCQRHFFYNRTAFSNAEFFQKMDHTHRMFLVNFAKALALHPLDFLRHWSVYKYYLRHWFNYFRGDFKGKRFLKSQGQVADRVEPGEDATSACIRSGR